MNEVKVKCVKGFNWNGFSVLEVGKEYTVKKLGDSFFYDFKREIENPIIPISKDRLLIPSVFVEEC